MPTSTIDEAPALPSASTTASAAPNELAPYHQTSHTTDPCDLYDLQDYAYVRRKWLSSRRRFYLRLNGAVISLHDNMHAPPDSHVSLLYSRPTATHHKTLSIVLATSAKLYIQFDSAAQQLRWLDAVRSTVHNDIHSHYTLGSVLGTGAFATVRQATCHEDGRIVAVKCINKSHLDPTMQREIERELYAMRHISHPHIVRTHAVYNTLHDAYVVMDHMEGGTMKDNVQSVGGRISETFARTTIRQVLLACSFLHGNGYIHRDIKLENLLCETESFPIHRVRLADFGYVNFVDNPHNACLISLLGTPVYIAPEIAARRKYGAPVDVYATGVMLFRMISGHYPYDGREDDDRTLQLAMDAHLRFSDPAWRNVSRKCRSFVRALLQRDPDRRLTARAALLHPWMTCAADALALAAPLVSPGAAVVAGAGGGGVGGGGDDGCGLSGTSRSTSRDGGTPTSLDKEKAEASWPARRLDLQRRFRRVYWAVYGAAKLRLLYQLSCPPRAIGPAQPSTRMSAGDLQQPEAEVEVEEVVVLEEDKVEKRSDDRLRVDDRLQDDPLGRSHHRDRRRRSRRSSFAALTNRLVRATSFSRTEKKPSMFGKGALTEKLMRTVSFGRR